MLSRMQVMKQLTSQLQLLQLTQLRQLQMFSALLVQQLQQLPLPVEQPRSQLVLRS